MLSVNTRLCVQETWCIVKSVCVSVLALTWMNERTDGRKNEIYIEEWMNRTIGEKIDHGTKECLTTSLASIGM